MDARSIRRIETFDPLLRDLVSWGLAVPGPSGDGTWLLVEGAQHRLAELAARSPVLAEGQLVYLDHRCGRCGRSGLTRLERGAYLCDSCRTPRAARVEGASPALSPGRVRRRRKADTPIAG
jgi:ribosomal protein L37AE/L43A